MKKAMVCMALLCLAGCSAEQLQESVKVNQAATESLALMKQIQADPNITDAEKVKLQIAVSAAYAEKVGLIAEEENQGFLNALEMAWGAYLATQPFGVAKMDAALLVTIITLALNWFRRQKNPL